MSSYDLPRTVLSKRQAKEIILEVAHILNSLQGEAPLIAIQRRVEGYLFDDTSKSLADAIASIRESIFKVEIKGKGKHHVY